MSQLRYSHHQKKIQYSSFDHILISEIKKLMQGLRKTADADTFFGCSVHPSDFGQSTIQPFENTPEQNYL
jgi:hypothetical protein